MSTSPSADQRPADDLVLEAAYRAEFSAEPLEAAAEIEVAGRRLRGGQLRGMALGDLAERVLAHTLLRRADETARLAALRFVERRLAEAEKPRAYEGAGHFAGFLRRVLSNLILDWLRSPAGRTEVRRVEYEGDPEGAFEGEAPTLPREQFETQRRLVMSQLVAMRLLRGGLPPGRSMVLRLALWPALTYDDDDREAIAAFAYCHETARDQTEARGCDAGKRCPPPSEAWREAYARELAEAERAEPAGLSRKTIATLTRIGAGKPMPKREGAVCERVSKGRMQLVDELRRAGIHGVDQ